MPPVNDRPTRLRSQRRLKDPVPEVDAEPVDALEAVTGQRFADLARDVQKEIHVAGAEPVMAAALEEDRPARPANPYAS